MREESNQGWGFSISSPAAAIASSSGTPCRSRRARACDQSVAPVARREPRQARPNRDPSSSTNTDTPMGRPGRNPRSRSRSTAANADTTPSGPSYAPPSSTESRCDPVTTAGREGPRAGGRESCVPAAGSSGTEMSHQATTLPKASDSRRRERASACSVNQAASSRSGAVKGWRTYPPDVADLPTGARSAHIRSK